MSNVSHHIAVVLPEDLRHVAAIGERLVVFEGDDEGGGGQLYRVTQLARPCLLICPIRLISFVVFSSQVEAHSGNGEMKDVYQQSKQAGLWAEQEHQ